MEDCSQLIDEDFFVCVDSKPTILVFCVPFMKNSKFTSKVLCSTSFGVIYEYFLEGGTYVKQGCDAVE